MARFLQALLDLEAAETQRDAEVVIIAALWPAYWALESPFTPPDVAARILDAEQLIARGHEERVAVLEAALSATDGQPIGYVFAQCSEAVGRVRL